MNTQEAKEILAAFRPGTDDEQDPIFAEALQMARTNSELKAWWNDSLVFDKRMRRDLRRVIAPAPVREAILAGQFTGGLAKLSAEQFARIVLAYEPVWAIGTGKTATPGMAAAAHSFLRGQVAAHFGSPAAEECRILYGGSVNPGNCAALMEEDELDGALVGGASLDPNSFAAIVKC